MFKTEVCALLFSPILQNTEHFGQFKPQGIEFFINPWR